MVIRARKPAMRDITNMPDAKAKKVLEKAKDAYEFDDKFRDKFIMMHNMKKPVYYRGSENIQS
jgi:hypothetical protein